jgi:hypothetical protein
MHSMRTGMDLRFRPSMKLVVDYLSHWVAHRGDALYGDNGSVGVRAAPSATSSHVGDEVDTIFEYKISKHYTVGGGSAFFRAGSFLRQTTSGAGVKYPYAFVTFNR